MATAKRRANAPTSPELMGFPERLRRARDQYEKRFNVILTQKDLAKMSGLSQPVISRLLPKTGRPERFEGITANSVIGFANGLGVTVGWLMAAEGEQIPLRPDTRVKTPKSA